MKTLHDIQNKILSLTINIKVNYPELYTMLDENPVTIPSGNRTDMTVSIMEDYLETLKEILKQYIKNHKKN